MYWQRRHQLDSGRAVVSFTHAAPGRVILLASMLVLLAWLAAGCGSTEEASSTPDQIDAEPLVELGAAPVVVDGLTAADLTLEDGTVAIFSANSTRAGADVSFDLEGPWDFSDGSDAFTMTMETLAASDAPFSDDFPDASIVVYSSWEPALVEAKYSFQDLDDNAWRAYGEANENSVVTFSGPSRALLFPARVGDQWTDTYEKVEGDVVTGIVAENRIVSLNTLAVPAGEFDAFLLQSRITATRDRQSVTTWDYTWLVPGIGRAAEIVSLPDEKEAVFERAYIFYRLESHSGA